MLIIIGEKSYIFLSSSSIKMQHPYQNNNSSSMVCYFSRENQIFQKPNLPTQDSQLNNTLAIITQQRDHFVYIIFRHKQKMTPKQQFFSSMRLLFLVSRISQPLAQQPKRNQHISNTKTQKFQTLHRQQKQPKNPSKELQNRMRKGINNANLLYQIAFILEIFWLGLRLRGLDSLSASGRLLRLLGRTRFLLVLLPLSDFLPHCLSSSIDLCSAKLLKREKQGLERKAEMDPNSNLGEREREMGANLYMGR